MDAVAGAGYAALMATLLVRQGLAEAETAFAFALPTFTMFFALRSMSKADRNVKDVGGAILLGTYVTVLMDAPIPLQALLIPINALPILGITKLARGKDF